MLIQIKKLRINTIIGTNDWERQTPQEVTIDIRIDVDAESSTETDDLNDTLDYADIARSITLKAAKWKFFLLEKLAAEILKIIIADARVSGASVEAEKTSAIPDAKGVSVTVKYDRESDTFGTFDTLA